jgi:hypothetical protein
MVGLEADGELPISPTKRERKREMSVFAGGIIDRPTERASELTVSNSKFHYKYPFFGVFPVDGDEETSRERRGDREVEEGKDLSCFPLPAEETAPPYRYIRVS